MMRRLIFLLLALGMVLGTLISCGGSGGGSAPAPAVQAPLPARPPEPAAQRTLCYVNPVSSGFRLEVDPATNNTPHLVLHLKGPDGLEGRGVAFYLHAHADRLAWSTPPGATGLVRNGGLWDPGAAEPRLMRAKARDGVLQVGLFQRDGAAVRMGQAPLASLALDLKAGAATGRVDLWLPGDQSALFLDAARNLQPFVLAVGTLTVQ